MGLLRCRAGPDNGSERLDAVWSYAVSGLSLRMLPDVEAEEVKPRRAQCLCQGVGDAGFGVFAFSAHLCQPCFGNVLCFLSGAEVLGNDDMPVG